MYAEQKFDQALSNFLCWFKKYYQYNPPPPHQNFFFLQKKHKCLKIFSETYFVYQHLYRENLIFMFKKSFFAKLFKRLESRL